MENGSRRIAVLIDAENILPSTADEILRTAGERGTIAYKEIYGGASALAQWAEPIFRELLHVNLSIRTTKGKNTSDIALVIGAMDILLKGDVDCLAVVSSDSDFSPLALRVRKAGLTMLGMGLETSNPLWRAACSEFVVLGSAHAGKNTVEAEPEAVIGEPERAPVIIEPPKKPVKKAPEQESEEDVLARRERIRRLIERTLRGNGGRVSCGQLASALNQSADYRRDKSKTGYSKALKYLSTVFSDLIRVEVHGVDRWVCLADYPFEEEEPKNDQAPVADAHDDEPDREPLHDYARELYAGPEDQAEDEPVLPEDQAEPMPDEVIAVLETLPIEGEICDEGAGVPEPAEVIGEAPVAEMPSGSGEDEVLTEPATGEPIVVLDETEALAIALVSEGIEEEKAYTAAELMNSTIGPLQAYNRMRALYGNAEGSRIYRVAREHM